MLFCKVKIKDGIVILMPFNGLPFNPGELFGKNIESQKNTFGNLKINHSFVYPLFSSVEWGLDPICVYIYIGIDR